MFQNYLIIYLFNGCVLSFQICDLGGLTIMPKADLAKFGRSSEGQVKNFRIALIIWRLVGSYPLNMATLGFFFCNYFYFIFKIWFLKCDDLGQKFPPKKSLCTFQILFFFFFLVRLRKIAKK
jgi:hypothetical protein